MARDPTTGTRRREGDKTTIRHAARNRTSKGLGFRPGSLRDYELPEIAPGAPGLGQAARLGGKAVKAVALDPAKELLEGVAGATTGMGSVRTPRDLLGRERKAAGVIALNFTPTGKAARLAGPVARAFARPLRGGGFVTDSFRPHRRVPTVHEEWEILKNKPGEPIVGLAGTEEWHKGGRKGRLRGTREQIADAASQVAEYQALGRNDPTTVGDENFQIMLDQAMRRLRYAQDRYDLARNPRSRHGTPEEWSFSAVEAGTNLPHQSLTMQVTPNRVYVPTYGDLTKTQVARPNSPLNRRQNQLLGDRMLGYREPKAVPPQVSMQLMLNALGPEKPVAADIINRPLYDMLRRAGDQRGIDMRDLSYAGTDPPMTMAQRRRARGAMGRDTEWPQTPAEPPPTPADPPHDFSALPDLGDDPQDFGRSQWAQDLEARAQQSGLTPRAQYLQERMMERTRRRFAANRETNPEPVSNFDIEELRRNVARLQEQIERNRRRGAR